jgi:hypothetical protein
MNDCKCKNWVRDDMPLITEHHPKCKHYYLEGEARQIIEGLVKGILAWAADEDGVHPDCWDAYVKGCCVIGKPHMVNNVRDGYEEK